MVVINLTMFYINHMFGLKQQKLLFDSIESNQEWIIFVFFVALIVYLIRSWSLLIINYTRIFIMKAEILYRVIA